MKIKLLFLALVIAPFLTQNSFLNAKTKFKKATLTLENGTTLEGYTKLVSSATRKIEFRETEEAKSTFMLFKEVKEIVYVFEDGSTSIARKFHFLSENKKGTKKSKKKYWYYVKYDNGLIIAVEHVPAMYGSYPNGGGMYLVRGSSTDYHVSKEGEDGVYFLASLSTGGLSLSIGMKKYLNKVIPKTFKILFGDNDAFIKAIEDEDFNEDSYISRLIELYEAHFPKK